MSYEKLFKRAGEELKLLTTVEEIRQFLELDDALTGITPAMISNWNTAYSWGNHATAGYLTSLPAHTHPLSDLQQSGASANQVPQWNGSAWVPATISAGNIYTQNGTLTGNRQLTLGGFTFSMLSGANTAFHLFANGRAWFGNGSPVDGGFQVDVNGTFRASGTITAGGNINVVSGNRINADGILNFANWGTDVLRLSNGFVSFARNGSHTFNADVNFSSNSTTSFGIIWRKDSATGFGGCIAMLTGIGGSGSIQWSRYALHDMLYSSGNSAPVVLYASGDNGGWAFGASADYSPHSSAMLTINSTTKGFLPPRMTGAQAEAIATPAAGLLVYINNGNGAIITTTGWWGYNGTIWLKLN